MQVSTVGVKIPDLSSVFAQDEPELWAFRRTGRYLDRTSQRVGTRALPNQMKGFGSASRGDVAVPGFGPLGLNPGYTGMFS